MKTMPNARYPRALFFNQPDALLRSSLQLLKSKLGVVTMKEATRLCWGRVPGEWRGEIVSEILEAMEPPAEPKSVMPREIPWREGSAKAIVCSLVSSGVSQPAQPYWRQRYQYWLREHTPILNRVAGDSSVAKEDRDVAREQPKNIPQEQSRVQRLVFCEAIRQQDGYPSLARPVVHLDVKNVVVEVSQECFADIANEVWAGFEVFADGNFFPWAHKAELVLDDHEKVREEGTESVCITAVVEEVRRDAHDQVDDEFEKMDRNHASQANEGKHVDFVVVKTPLGNVGVVEKDLLWSLPVNTYAEVVQLLVVDGFADQRVNLRLLIEEAESRHGDMKFADDRAFQNPLETSADEFFPILLSESRNRRIVVCDIRRVDVLGTDP